MRISSTKKWIALRQEFYLSLRAQVEHRLGLQKGEIQSYQKQYEKDLSGSWKNYSTDQFIDKVKKSKLILLADFHALQQSQKAHLRILRKCDSKSVILVMECFYKSKQHLLDQFVQGNLIEKDFLKAIEWKRTWGFPWQHYKPILKWAIAHRVPVYGANLETDDDDPKALFKRDQFAADLVASLHRKHPTKSIFLQYGDLHLAKSKLPQLLQKKIPKSVKPIRVLQNAEKIYFQLMNQGIENQVDLVQISSNTFCLLNVPPWVKWQNYLLFLEQSLDTVLRSKKTYDPIEFTDHVASHVKLIKHELGLEVSVSALSVFTTEDQGMWAKIEKTANPAVLSILKTAVEEGISFYFPPLQMGYLARPTVNHSAQLAAQYVISQVQNLREPLFHFPQDFHRLIWFEGLSYFCTKLVNPKRKTDTIFDIKTSLASPKTHEFGRESLLLSLAQKTKELLVLSGKNNAKLSFVPHRKKSYYIAARLLGGLIGERLYYGLRRNRLNAEFFKRIFERDLLSSSFDHSYYEILEVIESLPMEFKSKADKL
jgi:hypothetical protein